jgi:hypothetical protein
MKENLHQIVSLSSPSSFSSSRYYVSLWLSKVMSYEVRIPCILLLYTPRAVTTVHTAAGREEEENKLKAAISGTSKTRRS